MPRRSKKNVVSTLLSTLAKPASVSPRSNRRRRNRRRRRQNRFRYRPSRNSISGFSAIPRALPAAYSKHVASRFRVVSRSQNSLTLSGCDLVYSIPNTVSTTSSGIFVCIPCNPAYWKGTRIAQMAPAYLNYRPIQFTASYVPQVAVTQAGSVFMGTLWNTAPVSNDLQQTLVTSNGGLLTPCYTPADTTVTLATNLPYNLFTIGGSLSEQSNPFNFFAGIAGPNMLAPGYFYISYTYEFKNPVGTALTFARSDPGQFSTLAPPVAENVSLVTFESLTETQTGSISIGAGAVLDVENNGNKYYYRGTEVYVPPATVCQYFSNSVQSGN